MNNKNYPKDYCGPKAGISSREEWYKITEYQAFKHIKFEDWNYSDFDCWLATRDEWHYTRGEQNALNSLKEAQKIMGIKSVE